mmetsp:Transcript_54335/g.151316  ORF Transcript_54335/g.151316 Transcript_54335/m.151316 type:complete len:234 (-) Transcript_54335:1551-2252(-)
MDIVLVERTPPAGVKLVEDIFHVSRTRITQQCSFLVGSWAREVLAQERLCLRSLGRPPRFVPTEVIRHDVDHLWQGQTRRRRIQERQARAPGENVAGSHRVLVGDGVTHLGLEIWITCGGCGTLVQPWVMLVEPGARTFHRRVVDVSEDIASPGAIVTGEMLRHVEGQIEFLCQPHCKVLVIALGESFCRPSADEGRLQRAGRSGLLAEDVVALNDLVNAVLGHLAPSRPLPT